MDIKNTESSISNMNKLQLKTLKYPTMIYKENFQNQITEIKTSPVSVRLNNDVMKSSFVSSKAFHPL